MRQFKPYEQEPGSFGQIDWKERLEPLKKKPGTWFVVNESTNKSTAHGMKKRLVKKFPEFEFKGETNGSGSKLYAKLKNNEVK